ncbi:hypothetical protein DER46DRAFT_613674 [Fusarium sp. MPI-SDFR-AT-0072]|nr:hypothetical protein DER46DRAFT_613674 [Fusarium sp. MPI-SDFR-AT-0072]
MEIFSKDKLAKILQYLIGQGVFRSPAAAALEVPDLCDIEIASTQPYETVDRVPAT